MHMHACSAHGHRSALKRLKNIHWFKLDFEFRLKASFCVYVYRLDSGVNSYFHGLKKGCFKTKGQDTLNWFQKLVRMELCCVALHHLCGRKKVSHTRNGHCQWIQFLNSHTALWTSVITWNYTFFTVNKNKYDIIRCGTSGGSRCLQSDTKKWRTAQTLPTVYSIAWHDC